MSKQAVIMHLHLQKHLILQKLKVKSTITIMPLKSILETFSRKRKRKIRKGQRIKLPLRVRAKVKMKVKTTVMKKRIREQTKVT